MVRGLGVEACQLLLLVVGLGVEPVNPVSELLEQATLLHLLLHLDRGDSVDDRL